MTSSEIILSVLLVVSLCILSLQFWKNSIRNRPANPSPPVQPDDQFSVISKIIEQERSRISAELHDELGTLLSLIYLDLEVVTREASALTPYAENKLNEIKRNLDLVIESIRTNIWNLSAQRFNELDLAFSVRELCHKFDRHRGTHVIFVQSGNPFHVDEEYKLNLFRITQELLTNAIKHSSAWNISVHLHWDVNQALSITVEDDGVAYSAGKNTEGLGMFNIAKRAEQINATIERQTLDKGYRIVLSLTIP